MKLTLILPAIFALGAAAFPAPVTISDLKKRAASNPTDTQILNYALTLEHLENAFYTQALGKYDVSAFEKAGFPSWVRGRFVEIGQHEAAHVAFLQSVLGANATKPCTYNFPYTDPKSFAALAMAFEGTGVSAYSGAAQFLSSPAYLTAAAVVLSTEARHNSWITAVTMSEQPWSGAFDTPLGLNEVYTIASAFITSCPSSNPVLPVKAFPALAFPTSTAPGKTVKPTFNATSSGSKFVAFYSGVSQEIAEINSSGEVKIPSGLMGTVYAVVTTNGTAATSANTIAGPAILEFPFDSNGKLIA